MSESEPASTGVTYVVSDLHLGGDEKLGDSEFVPELLEFLRRVRREDVDEIVVNGDAFGLWEMTEVDGVEAMDAIVESYPEVFEELERTASEVDVTFLPGNHDHDLAAYPEVRERLSEFGLDVDVGPATRREIGGVDVWLEHGCQQDPNNEIVDWGNRYVTPLGYYYNTRVTSKAGRLSEHGRYDWLADVQAVTPTQRMPSWLASKYFYVEMHPLLRYAFIPFLLLFNVSLVLVVLSGLDVAGVWSLPAEFVEGAFGFFGRVGETAYLLLYVNLVVVALLTLAFVPVALIVRDIRRTVERFGLFEDPLTVDPTEPYEEYARELFESEDVDVFCFGHTHRPKVDDVDGGLLVNSGTWLKRLHRRDVVAGRLPPVYYPSYEMAAVRLSPHADGLSVEFVEVDKPSPAPQELTLTERLLTLGRKPSPELPDDVVVSKES
ncbi:MAG: metallophosphoesterase [Halobacteriales archaeon]